MRKESVAPAEETIAVRPAAWAERLAAQHLQSAPVVKAPDPAAASRHLTKLWALFDRAQAEANEAFAELGLDERISTCEEGAEHRYCMVAADGTHHYIGIVSVMPTVQGRLSGGAFIHTSSTRASIYVEPNPGCPKGSWHVAATGAAFDHEQVQDLFLSVFANDPEANSHLSPVSGMSIYDTPWD